MMQRKQHSESPLAIDVKLAELEKSREGLIASIITLEKSGAVPAAPTDPKNDTGAAAYALLSGSAENAPPTNNDPDVELFNKRHELEVVEKAIALGQRQALKAHGNRTETIAKQRSPEWAELQRQRAIAVATLLKINQRIEALKGEISPKGPMPNLALDGYTHRLFGADSRPTVTNHWPLNYLRACIQAGIVTEKEINK